MWTARNKSGKGWKNLDVTHMFGFLWGFPFEMVALLLKLSNFTSCNYVFCHEARWSWNMCQSVLRCPSFWTPSFRFMHQSLLFNVVLAHNFSKLFPISESTFSSVLILPGNHEAASHFLPNIFSSAVLFGFGTPGTNLSPDQQPNPSCLEKPQFTLCNLLTTVVPATVCCHSDLLPTSYNQRKKGETPVRTEAALRFMAGEDVRHLQSILTQIVSQCVHTSLCNTCIRAYWSTLVAQWLSRLSAPLLEFSEAGSCGFYHTVNGKVHLASERWTLSHRADAGHQQTSSNQHPQTTPCP